MPNKSRKYTYIRYDKTIIHTQRKEIFSKNHTISQAHVRTHSFVKVCTANDSEPNVQIKMNPFIELAAYSDVFVTSFLQVMTGYWC